MTPARTLTLALICARAFTYDLTQQKEHNCTISTEDNAACNITKYENNEHVNATIDQAYEVKHRSNHSREKNDLDVLHIEDTESGLYHVSVSRKSDEVDNNSSNIHHNHNSTKSKGRYFYDQDPEKLGDNIFSYNDSLQAHYLADSEHSLRGNFRKAFDETLFSDVSQDDVIYELSDEQYYAMPRMFELDDYASCIGARGAYCLGSFELAPIGKSTLFSVMQRFSANWVDNFNHTRLHRGVCLQRSCAPPPPHVHGLEAWFESCINTSTVSTYNLTARLYHLDDCTTGNDASPLTTSEKAFAAFIVLLIVLTVVSTVLDVTLSNDVKKEYGWALSWSLPSSWQRLTASPQGEAQEASLRVLDGLRVLCMLSVIVEHVCWLATQAYVADTRYVELSRRSSDAMLLANSTVMVQIFFMMSSFLLAHKLLQEQQRQSAVVTFFKMMFNRIIRISPSYMVVLWFASSWWARGGGGGGGPQWARVRAEAGACRRQWPHHLLYLNNLIDTGDKCLIQTWYLAADMQLYALSLALTLWLRRGGRGTRRALAVLGVSAGALVVGNLVLAYALRLVPTFVLHNPELIRSSYSGRLGADEAGAGARSFYWVYTSPAGNAGAALAGLLLALLHRARLAERHRLPERRWFRVMSVWSVPATVCVVALWPHVAGAGAPPRLAAAASAALERPVFVALVTVALYGALSGVDSPWARCMSRGSACARLSFGALLLHMLLINAHLATRPAPAHLDRQAVYVEWFGFSILSYLAAIPLALLVEFPAQRLHKEITILLKRKYKQINKTEREKSKVN